MKIIRSSSLLDRGNGVSYEVKAQALASTEDGEDAVGVSFRCWRSGFTAQKLVHFIETGEVAYKILIAATR